MLWEERQETETERRRKRERSRKREYREERKGGREKKQTEEGERERERERGNSVLMRTPSSMKHGGNTMPVTIAAPTMVPGLHWLCSLMHTSGSRSTFRATLPMGSNHPDRTVLCGSSEFQRKNFSSEPNAVCHGPRAQPRATARHGKPSISVLGRASSTALGDLREGRATTSSATCPVSCVDGARSESAVASRSRPFRSRPEPHLLAVASADVRLTHRDADASASS